MAENVVGSVVGKVRFNIDKASWDNLASFQAKLSELKTAMSGMDNSIKVNAVVSQINKVANATVNAEKKVAAATKASRGNVGRTNKAADLNGRLSHLFPATTLSSPAGKTLFAQMLRDEEKATIQLERDKERAYNTRRKEVMGRRNAQLRSRAARDRQQTKLTERGNRNRTAFEAGVANFMLIKGSQIEQYADRVKMSQEGRNEMHSWLAKSKEDALKGIDPTQARAIESFRAQVNKTKNEMVNADRITRANAVTFRSLRNEVVQLTAAYTAFSVVQNIATTGMQMEGLRASAKVFAKDEAGVADHMSFIADEANRIGVNFQTAAQEFTKFSISTKNKFDASTQRNLFSGISEYAAVLQIDQQQYQRLFKSIQQMSDKGLYAEEIYGF